MSYTITFWGLVHLFSVLGYDGYSSCTKPFRGGKRLDVPCDFSTQSWCTVPGSYYPWKAVRRFVYENHGLMRRMYGNERHISVLRSEIESNDVNYLGDKWTHGINNFKHFKPSKEEYKSAMRTTTVTSTTTSTTPKPLTTNSTSTTSKYSSSYPTTTQLNKGGFESTTIQTETPESDVPTTEYNTEESTTIPAELPTTNNTAQHSLPASGKQPSVTNHQQIFQDTLEKKTTSTTEKPQLFYKSRGVNACPVKEEVVAPFWANNTRGEVLALLNLYPFEQYVHWERCTFENKQMFCREGCRCEQQYRLHRLLAYDPSNDCRGIFSDWFKFPSCCVCRCYNLPTELRLTSRSPRGSGDSLQEESERALNEK